MNSRAIFAGVVVVVLGGLALEFIKKELEK